MSISSEFLCFEEMTYAVFTLMLSSLSSLTPIDPSDYLQSTRTFTSIFGFVIYGTTIIIGSVCTENLGLSPPWTTEGCGCRRYGADATGRAGCGIGCGVG